MDDSSSIYSLEVSKEISDGLGIRISLRPKNDSPEKGYFITLVEAEGLVGQTGMVQEGDELLSIIFDSEELTIGTKQFFGEEFNSVNSLIKELSGVYHLTLKRHGYDDVKSLGASSEFFEDEKSDYGRGRFGGSREEFKKWNNFRDSERSSRASGESWRSKKSMTSGYQVTRMLPDLPQADKDVLVKDGRQEEIIAYRSPRNFLPEVEEIQQRPIVEILWDDSKTHMFSPLITDEEMEKLPLVTPGGSQEYCGRVLDKKLEKLRKKLTTGELVSNYRKIPMENSIETQHGATMQYNVLRNRYPDIYPYDSTRVVLKNELHDYINASHVRLSLANESLEDKITNSNAKKGNNNCSKTVWYIAAQTPLINTVSNFWTMVWQQRVCCVVNLANPVENGQVNCLQFWPSHVGSSASYGEHRVTLEYSQTLENFSIHKLKLHSYITGADRNIMHVIYNKWSHFSEISATPNSTIGFIQFCNFVMMNSHESSPLLVCCNDGVGRTSLFIGLHFVISCIKLGLLFEIEQIVQQCREWRPNMFNVEDYAEFLGECCYELINSLKL